MLPNKAGFFKVLNILFIALLIGQVIFFILALALKYSGTFNTSIYLPDSIMFFVPLIMIICIFISNYLFRSKLQSTIAKTNLNDKLDAYRGAYITRLALLEGGNIIAIISYLLTGISFLAGFALAGIAFFFYVRPKKEKIINELGLTFEEVEMM